MSNAPSPLSDLSTPTLRALATDSNHPPWRRFCAVAVLLDTGQDAAAAASGLHLDTIRRVLQGGSAAISTLEAIEKAYGIPEQELREGGR